MLRPAAAFPRQTCCQFTVTTPTAEARRASQVPSPRPAAGLPPPIRSVVIRSGVTVAGTGRSKRCAGVAMSSA
jgi:hypothetical protein